MSKLAIGLGLGLILAGCGSSSSNGVSLLPQEPTQQPSLPASFTVFLQVGSSYSNPPVVSLSDPVRVVVRTN
ncbi:hypothetical protein L1047_15330 [Synechococcus sp. Nb3U1]|uniref:hypothetical protein n=1 Tax=Synechococcus sp. Nb3U1 TaxID=1914529 RepID=UPI001F3B9257|nr:hypothetical protein [Synechococcus sp. Nb3U1]MCF2972567.1 hypothetical protein [Synechococcus sp. Nb3U1]